jgi:hypothetical protein
MKKLKWIILGTVAVLVIGLAVVYVNLNSIVRQTVEVGGVLEDIVGASRRGSRSIHRRRHPERTRWVEVTAPPVAACSDYASGVPRHAGHLSCRAKKC